MTPMSLSILSLPSPLLFPLDSQINDLCKLACIEITDKNLSLRKEIILDVNTILRCAQAIEVSQTLQLYDLLPLD